MRDSEAHIYRVTIVTLDRHAAGPIARVAPRLAADFPGLELTVHAAAEWAEDHDALRAAQEAVTKSDIIISSVLFLEEHVRAILPQMQTRRDRCDAFVGLISDA